jgi:hypothetical protein
MSKLTANKLLWMTAALLFVAACNKSQPKSEEASPTPLVRSVTPPEQQIVQKTFSVQKYQSFELQIPPHCMRPRLHGNFKSFRYGEKGNRASDEASSIDLLLLDEQQFNDFVNGPGDATTRSAQNTYEQQIDWALPSSFETPRKYYLVFNNATGKPKTKIVEADLTLSFD